MNSALLNNAALPEPDSLAARISRLAGVLGSERYPTGDKAALKRHAPGQPPPLAFYRLWLRHLDAELPAEAMTQPWAMLAWGLAICGSKAHRADRGFGRALAESGCTESRLERLLAARDEISRMRLFASVVRVLASKREGFDWLHAAQLLMTQDDARRELIHRRIAADYYRHAPRAEKE